MAKKKGSIGSLRSELIRKSREAALSAIRTYNDPLIRFKSETYIVLMMIAWTYLLHAYYRSKKIDYRYFDQLQKRRRFHRTKRGAYKYWELERCLSDAACPIDGETQTNLRFLIGLRHEIEHQMSTGLDEFSSSRYQACAVNYNAYLKQLFGPKEGLDAFLGMTLQFAQLEVEQFENTNPPALPKRLASYVAEFDGSLSSAEFNSPRFAYRVLFTRKLVNKPGQADRVIEFVDSKSEMAQSIEKEYWVKKEVERPKFRPHEVVTAVQKAGFPKFRRQPDHVDMWKAEDGKNPGKGYGVMVSGTWFWYQLWIDRCIERFVRPPGRNSQVSVRYSGPPVCRPEKGTLAPVVISLTACIPQQVWPGRGVACRDCVKCKHPGPVG